MKVIVSGYYGFKNLGDELILRGINRILKDMFNNVEITVISQDTEYTQRIHQMQSIHRDSYEEIKKAIRSTDLVILGGGGLFHDHYRINPANLFERPKSGIHSYTNVPLLAKIFDKPVAYLFHGVGPLFSDEAIYFCRWAFSLADFISVRDQYSYILLRKLGIEKVILGADPALLNLEGDRGYKQNDSIRLGISARQFLHPHAYAEERLINGIAEFLNSLNTSDRNLDIFLMSFQEHDQIDTDTPILEAILQKTKIRQNIKIVKLPLCSLEEVDTIFASLNYVIGMRFHSNLMAFKFKKPFIAIGYDQKILSFLNELGINDFLIDPFRITSKEIIDKFKKLKDESNRYMPRFDEAYKLLMDRLNTSLKSLKDFLEHCA